jgi:photosystem II stability/assembly factor-like uncharacterized protein
MDHERLYLGTANGWIYQSRDDGKSWTRLSRIGNRDDLVLKKILVDPANSRHILVGAYVPVGKADGGIYSSNDGGTHWSSAPGMEGQSVRALTFAPSNSKIVVAGTLEGVFRSSDGGAHWEQISPKASA